MASLLSSTIAPLSSTSRSPLNGPILNHETLAALGGIEALNLMCAAELLQLQYTHLLLPNVGPELGRVLPVLLDVLSATLVVLDISDNDLTAIPTAIRHCTALEEFNVSGNPVHQLPSTIGNCVNLGVLIADHCMLQTLPSKISQLPRLHTILIRKNVLVSLPSWLCLLPHLKYLLVDGNPFAPQWDPVVAPILAANFCQQSPTESGLLSHTPSSLGFKADTSGIVSDGTAPTSPTSSYTSSGSQYSNKREIHVRSQPVASPRVAMEISSTISPAIVNSHRFVLDRTHDGTLPDPSMRCPVKLVGSVERLRSCLPTKSAGRAIQTRHHLAPMEELEAEEGYGRPKWGFRRKLSMHHLRSGKGEIEKLPASVDANGTAMPIMRRQPSPSGQMPSLQPRLPQVVWGAHFPPVLKGSNWKDNKKTHSFPSALPAPITSSKQPELSTKPYRTLPMAGRGAEQIKFLSQPVDSNPTSLILSIPVLSPQTSLQVALDREATTASIPEANDAIQPLAEQEHSGSASKVSVCQSQSLASHFSVAELNGGYDRGLLATKSYLRDLYDLSLPAVEPRGISESIGLAHDQSTGPDRTPEVKCDNTRCPSVSNPLSRATVRSNTTSQDNISHDMSVTASGSRNETKRPPVDDDGTPYTRSRGVNDDRSLRTHIIREIFETERTYVGHLTELVSIYVDPASRPVGSSKETMIPVRERKVVFGNVETILSIHRDHILPSLEQAVCPLLDRGDDPTGILSEHTAYQVGEIFRTYWVYMKQYSAYINNFDNALRHITSWSSSSSRPATGRGEPCSGSHLTPSRKDRARLFVTRAKAHAKHSQIDLASYLILPVQRVPRYKLLLENLALCTRRCQLAGPADALNDAISGITYLASLINEERRAAESRLQLLHWQQRIGSRHPLPLVQPHRKLILEGALSLVGVAKKVSAYVEVTAKGDGTRTDSVTICPVEYIKMEHMNMPIIFLLCSDELVIIQQSLDKDWQTRVDGFEVLPLATLHVPASVIGVNSCILRVVSNEVSSRHLLEAESSSLQSIYYFDGASHSSTLQWCHAINQQQKEHQG